MARTAIYPGIFDPITNGHLDVIKRATVLFDNVIVGIFTAPFQETSFSAEERLKIVQIACQSFENLTIKLYNDLTINFAKKEGAIAIIRGLENVTAFDLQFQATSMNKKLASDIETVFLAASPEYLYLTSKLVQQVAMVGGCIKGLVPQVVEDILEQHYRLKYGHKNKEVNLSDYELCGAKNRRRRCYAHYQPPGNS